MIEIFFIIEKLTKNMKIDITKTSFRIINKIEIIELFQSIIELDNIRKNLINCKG